MTTKHRHGCTCRGNENTWTCAVCGGECAPCWGGYADDEQGDVCGVCDFQEHAFSSHVRFFVVDAEVDMPLGDPESYTKERIRALRAAAGQSVDHMPVHAILDENLGTWTVVAVEQGILMAWRNAQYDCEKNGHPGAVNLGSGRCCRCGEKVDDTLSTPRIH